MRQLEETRRRWDATFHGVHDLADLQQAVRSNDAATHPCRAGLRSVCWKAFLVFANLDQSTWPKILDNSRSAYTALREHFLPNAKQREQLATTDPLADDVASPWTALRKDELLRAEILQDVERCMPDRPYFRDVAVQQQLVDVLFVFCKLNTDIGYRQGMHEVLAPILWVVAEDAVDNKDPIGSRENGSDATTNPKRESLDQEQLIAMVLDAQYVEHDAFGLFCMIMQTAKSFYEPASNALQAGAAPSTHSAIVERSIRIQEDYLRAVDAELAAHLTAIDVLPQIFIIRWIRLLFGREFPFEAVLEIWDRLFAEDPRLTLVDYICVAMLLRIRWQLLDSDYSSALGLLLRYPAPEAPHTPISFLDDAISLRTDLSPASGAAVLAKYSNRPFTTRGASRSPSPVASRASTRSPRRHLRELSNTSPLRLPGQIFQESGIETLLQDAAKGVVRQSERFGLPKALRGALQGLQSAHQSPRGRDSPRGSLDEDRSTTDADARLQRRIEALEALEARNRSLGSLVQTAMQDLSKQIAILESRQTVQSHKQGVTDDSAAIDATTTETSAVAQALTLTVARLQYVQLYLEDSSLPLAKDGESPHVAGNDAHEVSTSSQIRRRNSGEGERSAQHSSQMPATPPAHHLIPNDPKSLPTRLASPPKMAPLRHPPRHVKTPSGRADGALLTAASTVDSPTTASPFQQPRPSLAESSYSWMLGDPNKGFQTAAPFSSDDRTESPSSKTRGRPAFLFGTPDRDSNPTKGDGKGERPKTDDDGFTLGTLQAPQTS